MSWIVFLHKVFLCLTARINILHCIYFLAKRRYHIQNVPTGPSGFFEVALLKTMMIFKYVE